MTAATEDPRTLRACEWFIREEWTVDINHEEGTATATSHPDFTPVGPSVVIDIVSLVYAIITDGIVR